MFPRADELASILTDVVIVNAPGLVTAEPGADAATMVSYPETAFCDTLNALAEQVVTQPALNGLVLGTPLKYGDAPVVSTV